MQLPPRDRILKYTAASAVGVVVGSSLLLLFLEVLHWNPVVANFASVTISSIPAYLINRYWVWQKRDRNSIRREVIPFWIMAFLGLLLSSLFVHWTKERTDESLLIVVANWSGFGVLWVAKFFVLDQVLFDVEPTEAVAEPDAGA